MTVKEFYDYAVKYGLENAKIILNYDALDGWYSLDNEEIKKEYLRRGDKTLIIEMYGDIINEEGE